LTGYLKSKTLVIFALESEEQNLFTDVAKLYCGIGKVNAAYHLTRALGDWRNQHGKNPELVLNLGSAGSMHFTTKSLINCTRFVQRDMDTTALGTPLFATPFEDGRVILTNGLRWSDFQEGTCGSGDNFVTDGVLRTWDVIDMEAYALAKVCVFEHIPFGCLKYITDGSDGAAAATWEMALKDAALHLKEAVKQIFI